MIRQNKAELVIEYALMIAIVATALMTMQTYINRGVQGILKVNADDFASFAQDYHNGINPLPPPSRPPSRLAGLDSQILGAMETLVQPDS